MCTSSPVSGFVDCRLNLGSPTRITIAATRPLSDPHAYAWSIAKWAYALAVAERGLDCCDTQAMRELLLGGRADAFMFVGTPTPRAAASRDWLHEHAVRESGPWLTVRLGLFASAGMLPYEVVIGPLAGRRPAPSDTPGPNSQNNAPLLVALSRY